MATYGRLPVAFERGEGAWLYATDGRKYLDALCGVAVTTLGHAHPAIVDAVKQRAERVVHVSNWFQIPEQEALADRVCEISGMDSAFFCNSGAEANEAAIKLARLYGSKKGIANPSIVVTQSAFHGRTIATLSAGGNRKIQAGFDPLLKGFKRVPFNDLDAVTQVAENSQDVVAVMVEPILGESGIIIPDEGYLAGLRKICDDNDWLLILDEIQTGMGRTGQWFAYQHEDILPDVLTLAKALGAGMPIGACVAHGKAAEVFQPGTHGSTFGGGPFVASIAATVIETMQKEGIIDRARDAGTRLLQALQQGLSDHPLVSSIRGKGLMLAVELNREIPDLLMQIVEQGLLVNVAGAGRIIRLLPPAVINEEEIAQIVDTIAAVLNKQEGPNG